MCSDMQEMKLITPGRFEILAGKDNWFIVQLNLNEHRRIEGVYKDGKIIEDEICVLKSTSMGYTEFFCSASIACFINGQAFSGTRYLINGDTIRMFERFCRYTNGAMTPEISEMLSRINIVRLRYPICPLHVLTGGSAEIKQMELLRSICTEDIKFPRAAKAIKSLNIIVMDQEESKYSESPEKPPIQPLFSTAPVRDSEATQIITFDDDFEPIAVDSVADSDSEMFAVPQLFKPYNLEYMYRGAGNSKDSITDDINEAASNSQPENPQPNAVKVEQQVAEPVKVDDEGPVANIRDSPTFRSSFVRGDQYKRMRYVCQTRNGYFDIAAIRDAKPSKCSTPPLKVTKKVIEGRRRAEERIAKRQRRPASSKWEVEAGTAKLSTCSGRCRMAPSGGEWLYGPIVPDTSSNRPARDNYDVLRPRSPLED